MRHLVVSERNKSSLKKDGVMVRVTSIEIMSERQRLLELAS